MITGTDAVRVEAMIDDEMANAIFNLRQAMLNLRIAAKNTRAVGGTGVQTDRMADRVQITLDDLNDLNNSR